MIITLAGIKFTAKTEEFEREKVNDEIVLYFRKIKKAMILNNTCSVIWDMIAQYEKDDGSLTDEQITDCLMEQFDLPQEERNNVICDVRELFRKLKEERVIHMKVVVREGA